MNTKIETIFKLFKRVHAVYKQSGFNIVTIFMDNQFDPMRDMLASISIQLNTVAADEDVGSIERYVQTIKERVRVAMNTMLFNFCPK